MNNLKELEKLVLEEKMTIGDFALAVIDSKIALAESENSLSLPGLKLRRQMWSEAMTAKERGKHLIFIGGALPMEIFEAMDCVVFHIDCVTLLFSEFTSLAAKYIEESAIMSDGGLCSLDRINLGGAILKNYGMTPELFVYNPVTCDSSRTAYYLIRLELNLPTYCFDLPGFRTERTAKYLSDQLEGCIAFLEERLGRKPDMARLKECMAAADRNFDLLKALSEKRKCVPCPVPSYLLSMGLETDYFACRRELTELLEAELAAAEAREKAGVGACKNEKHRVVMVQNMLWGIADLSQWMEDSFGAVPLLDVFGFRGEWKYEHPDDMADCLLVMSNKMLNTPVIHGASGSTFDYAEVIDHLFAEYSPDASIFLGNAGCRHIWASTKILTDMVERKHGKATLFVDMDFADGRYKSMATVKDQISEFFETVVK